MSAVLDVLVQLHPVAQALAVIGLVLFGGLVFVTLVWVFWEWMP